MRKFKKLHWRTKDPRTSWTGSKSIICQLYNIIGVPTSNSIANTLSNIQFSTRLSNQYMTIGWNSYETQIRMTPFFKGGIQKRYQKYSNLSIPGPDHVFWKHLKFIIDNDRYHLNIVNITSICNNLSYWPSYFKTSSLIIISKPNKIAYNSPIMF